MGKSGKPLSDNHKLKLRITQLGRKHSEETKKRMSESNKGHKTSEDTKRKMSVAKIKPERIVNGRIHLDRMLNSHKVWNEHNPNDTWRKGLVIHHKDENKLNDHISNLELMTKSSHMSLHRKGFKHTEETKSKMSLAKKGNKYSLGHKNSLGIKRSEEFKRKLSVAKTGKTHSDQSKKNMSEATKKWWAERKQNDKCEENSNTYKQSDAGA